VAWGRPGLVVSAPTNAAAGTRRTEAAGVGVDGAALGVELAGEVLSCGHGGHKLPAVCAIEGRHTMVSAMVHHARIV
jgi:hypothetical protein